MAYSATSKELVKYLKQRLADPKYHIEIEEVDEETIDIIRGTREIRIKTEVGGGKIRVSAEVFPAVKKGFSDYLENLVNNDSIFERGGMLYSEERKRKLPNWRKILRRIPEEGEKGVMSCEILSSASKKAIERAYYEYMVRVALGYEVWARNNST